MIFIHRAPPLRMVYTTRGNAAQPSISERQAFELNHKTWNTIIQVWDVHVMMCQLTLNTSGVVQATKFWVCASVCVCEAPACFPQKRTSFNQMFIKLENHQHGLLVVFGFLKILDCKVPTFFFRASVKPIY